MTEQEKELLLLAAKYVEQAEADARKNPKTEYIRIVRVPMDKDPYAMQIPNDSDTFRDIVGGHTEHYFIGTATTGAKIAIVCNEEGIMLGLPENRIYMTERGLMPIRGNFFITAVNMQGDNISLPFDHVEPLIQMFKQKVIV